MIRTLLDVASLLISFCTLVTLLYTFYKFTRRPHESLQEQVKLLNSKYDEIYKQLGELTAKSAMHDATNEVIIESTLALIEFEMQYCLMENKQVSEGLNDAKISLQKFLAKR